MLILIHNPKDLTGENLKFLAERLSVDQNAFEIYTFDTSPWCRDKGRPLEFVVIGFFAAQSALAGSD